MLRLLCFVAWNFSRILCPLGFQNNGREGYYKQEIEKINYLLAGTYSKMLRVNFNSIMIPLKNQI